MSDIRIEGLKELQNKLKDNVKLDDVKRVVRHNGAKLQEGVMNNADFKKGYATGTTKRSVELTFQDDGFTATVEPTTKYSQYLEYGTRIMEAQPFVRQAYEVQKKKCKQDMEKLVK